MHKAWPFAAKRLGIKATIVTPKHTPLIKVNATKQYGADVVLHGEIYDEACQKAMELQQEHGYVFVHPTSMMKMSSKGKDNCLEVLDELPDADVLLVPVRGRWYRIWYCGSGKVKKSAR